MPGSAPNCTHTCHTAVHAHRTTPWTRSCAHTGHPGVLTRTDTPTRTGTRARTHVYTATQALADTEQQAHMLRGARGPAPLLRFPAPSPLSSPFHPAPLHSQSLPRPTYSPLHPSPCRVSAPRARPPHLDAGPSWEWGGCGGKTQGLGQAGLGWARGQWGDRAVARRLGRSAAGGAQDLSRARQCSGLGCAACHRSRREPQSLALWLRLPLRRCGSSELSAPPPRPD